MPAANKTSNTRPAAPAAGRGIRTLQRPFKNPARLRAPIVQPAAGAAESPVPPLERRDEENAVAILGGAFDPPHQGHLHLAQRALAELPAPAIWIVPNGAPPHRPPTSAPWNDRIAMCELTFADLPVRIRHDESPARPDHPRFTVDTLRAFRRELQPESPAMIFIVGADAFAKLQQWREWKALFDLVHFAVATRRNDSPEWPEELQQFCADRVCETPSALASGTGRVYRWVPVPPPPEVSSSALRAMLSDPDGCESDPSLFQKIPPQVFRHVRKRNLYR